MRTSTTHPSSESALHMSSGKGIPLDKGNVVTQLSRVALGTRMIISGTQYCSTAQDYSAWRPHLREDSTGFYLRHWAGILEEQCYATPVLKVNVLFILQGNFWQVTSPRILLFWLSIIVALDSTLRKITHLGLHSIGFIETIVLTYYAPNLFLPLLYLAIVWA